MTPEIMRPLDLQFDAHSNGALRADFAGRQSQNLNCKVNNWSFSDAIVHFRDFPTLTEVNHELNAYFD